MIGQIAVKIIADTMVPACVAYQLVWILKLKMSKETRKRIMAVLKNCIKVTPIIWKIFSSVLLTIFIALTINAI